MCKLLCGTLVDQFVFYPQGDDERVRNKSRTHTELHIRVYISLIATEWTHELRL